MSTKNEANQIAAVIAALTNCIDWTEFNDFRGLTQVMQASKKTFFGKLLTRWIAEKAEECMLQKLGYPTTVRSRVTPDFDDISPINQMEVLTAFGPAHLGCNQLRPTGHDVYRAVCQSEVLQSCISLQMLIYLRDNPQFIPGNFHGFTILAWKSVANQKLDYVGDSKIVPALKVLKPGNGDNPKLEIEWKNLSFRMDLSDVTVRTSNY